MTKYKVKSGKSLFFKSWCCPVSKTFKYLCFSSMSESVYEYYQDFYLGIAYLGVAIFGFLRTKTYFDPLGAGRVITTFYFLITLTASLRAIWFLIPSSILEGSYIPEPIFAFESKKWLGYLMSEILLCLGSIALYSVFILVVSYWAYILRKSSIESTSVRSFVGRTSANVVVTRRGAIRTFLNVLMIILFVQTINIILFIYQMYNIQILVLLDSLLLSLISVVSMGYLAVYSQKIRSVMKMIGRRTTNHESSQLVETQIDRIFMITVVAVIFFIGRVAIELSFAITAIKELTGSIVIPCFRPHLILSIYFTIQKRIQWK